MSFKDQILPDKLPVHVSIIMDGNGRWARKQGKIRTFGHQHGVAAVRDTVEAAAELGIKYLSLYAFSTENWKRPRWEVDALMELLINTISKETKTLMDNNIRLAAIGDINSLPKGCRKQLDDTIKTTSGNTRMTLILALSYSSRWEIVDATRRIAADVKAGTLDPDKIDDNVFSGYLCTAFCPDPELLIRTSGEHRISNFMLWQIAYAELYFTEKLWPDFRREDFYEAIADFQKRDRRYGMVNEQSPRDQHA
jgi:undecaprenyl diphosphate synthase